MDNANLAKLRVSPGKLLPCFSSDVMQYSVTVSSSTEEVRVFYQTSDSGASCILKGGDENKIIKLKEGQKSNVELLVTAEDGKTLKIYSIAVRRLSADDAMLSSLETSIGILIPRFDPLTDAYCCYVTCSADKISVKATPEDQSMSVSIEDGVTPINAVPLNPGCTLVKLKVCSASGKGIKYYDLKVVKRPVPYVLRLSTETSDKRHLRCSICWNIPYRPSRTNVSQRTQLYCFPCLEELTRTNKTDIFTGQKLEGAWLFEDLEVEAELSNLQVVCAFPEKILTAPMGSIGALLSNKNEKKYEPTENCPDCSKKIPLINMATHKEMLCLAKYQYPSSFTKKEILTHSWETRLVDCTLGNNVQSILALANTIENAYLTALSKSDQSASLVLLQKAAAHYATAAKLAPSDIRTHLGLALVMEDLYYANDLYGIKNESDTEETDTEAEVSANEEEFAAICKLHGVKSTDSIALQLKAVEAEYHSLKQSGQAYKAEHVQQLHAWKSKQASQEIQGQGLLKFEMDGTISKAVNKLKDCISLSPADGISCFHLGRLYLLLQEHRAAATEYLKAALAVMPLFTPACICLGLALSPSNPTHAAPLLYQGLLEYLNTREYDCTTNATETPIYQELLSKSFYRPTNPLIVEGFLALAESGGYNGLVPDVCLLHAARCITDAHFVNRGAMYKRCVFLSFKARSMLLHNFFKNKDPTAIKHYKELCLCLANSGLPVTDSSRALQMQVCQIGVMLQPNSSEALYHLGNVQLAKYEAEGDESSLKESELSFKASISQEGLDIDASVVPEELESQEWWKSYKSIELDNNKKNLEAQESKKQSSNEKQSASQPIASIKLSNSAVSKPHSSTAAKTSQKSTKTATQLPITTSIPPKGTTRSSVSSLTTKTVNKQSDKPAVTKTAPKPSITATQTLNPPKAINKKSAQPTQAKASGKLSSQKNACTCSNDNSPSNHQLDTGTQISITPQKTITTNSEVPLSSKEKNTKSYLPRLGIARVLAKLPENNSKVVALYNDVISMIPELHEAYIELGAILSTTEPLAAVDIYSRFPFSNPPTFDDAFLHGEIVRLLISLEKYDDSRLCDSLISLGKAMGIGVLEKHVAILEAKYKTTLLKHVYAGVHGKSVNDPDLQQFFKFKCW